MGTVQDLPGDKVRVASISGGWTEVVCTCGGQRGADCSTTRDRIGGSTEHTTTEETVETTIDRVEFKLSFLAFVAVFTLLRTLNTLAMVIRF